MHILPALQGNTALEAPARSGMAGKSLQLPDEGPEQSALGEEAALQADSFEAAFIAEDLTTEPEVLPLPTALDEATTETDHAKANSPDIGDPQGLVPETAQPDVAIDEAELAPAATPEKREDKAGSLEQQVVGLTALPDRGPQGQRHDSVTVGVPQTQDAPKMTATHRLEAENAPEKQTSRADVPHRHIMETVMTTAARAQPVDATDLTRIPAEKTTGLQVTGQKVPAVSEAPALPSVMPVADPRISEKPARYSGVDLIAPDRINVMPAQRPVAPPVGPNVAQPVPVFAVSDVVFDSSISEKLSTTPMEIVQWDVRGSGPTHAATSAPVAIATRPDLPPHIAQQLAGALAKGVDKPVEIALNPPELGRVRMIMTASDMGMVVHVIADRSDTLDMMRRNIGDLGQALADLGYEDLAFAFGQSDAESAQNEDRDDGSDALSLEVADAAQPVPSSTAPLNMAQDGIDIRL